MADSNVGPSSDWMQQVIKKVRGENPDMAGTSIQPAGPISQTVMGNASGFANPLTGNIYYDPNAYQGMSPDIRENALTHELMHSRQINNQSYLDRLMNAGRNFFTPPEPYYERPNEMGAFQAERDRSLSHHLDTPDPITGRTDIQLTRPRKKSIAPSRY
jgi:hypothetical protein